MSTHRIQTFTLDKLGIHPDNVRKTKADAQADAELRASIASHGLLENLVVKIGAENMPQIVCGGRRYIAMVDLVEEGVIPFDHDVTCLVVPADADVHELSLAENTARVAMHPADQIEAFDVLFRNGVKPSAIGKRFGLSTQTVAQRLKLANVAPDIRQAFRDGHIDLDDVRAFSIADDQKRQLKVWKALIKGRSTPWVNAWEVKRMLTENAIEAGDDLAQFVGLETYEEAGGPVSRDLFGDRAFLDDAALLTRLANQKLREIVKDIRRRERGWSWIDTALRWSHYDDGRDMERAPLIAGPDSKAQKTEIRELRKAQEAADKVMRKPGGHGSPEYAEADKTWRELGLQIRKLERDVANAQTSRPKHRKYSGIVVTIEYGQAKIVRGLVKPEDKPAWREATGHKAEPGKVDAKAAPKARPVFSKKQGEDLAYIRNQAVRSHLARKPGLAFDLLVWHMVNDLINTFDTDTEFGYYNDALDINVKQHHDRPLRPDGGDYLMTASEKPRNEFLVQYSQLPIEQLLGKKISRNASFEAFRRLEDGTKRAIMAWCVAATLKPQLAVEVGDRAVLPEYEAVVEALEIDWPGEYTPDADSLFSRLPKARLAEIVRACVKDEAEQKRLIRMKKAELVAALDAAYNDPGSPTTALEYIPAGFRSDDTVGGPEAQRLSEVYRDAD